ncbi:hypothetical protein VTN49DRAFT_5293 [Thermomyces lanuginosus]|uniref:uncharacterized protein n=1 Tax=Thermomyces lanuginosus TaxID=5541 RepID=UPI00374321C3
MMRNANSSSSDELQLSRLRIQSLAPPPPSAPAAPLSATEKSRPLLPFESGTLNHASPSTSTPSYLSSTGGPLPAKLPTLKEFLNAARTNNDGDPRTDPASSSSATQPPPKTILPAFINLRAVEKLPYASFESDGLSRRRRLDVSGEHFTGETLQLPVPQTQSDKKPPPPFGPFTILNGLNEPPPNAALFPPIDPGAMPQALDRRPSETERPEKSAGHLGRREGRLEEILSPDIQDKSSTDMQQSEWASRCTKNNITVQVATASATSQRQDHESNDEPLSPRTRGRSRKNVRMWTEEETKDLLRGVIKCGIGNWTEILRQPELKFNKRSAANLKDRFRVCCPWAYKATDQNEAIRKLQAMLAEVLADSKPIDLVKTEHGDLDPSDSAGSTDSERQSTSSQPSKSDPGGVSSSPDTASKSKPSPASLGIPEPRTQPNTKRRSRRRFTSEEDNALLTGYAMYGFRWTRIQQDKRLNLSHRRATDLRDRFRNLLPYVYREGCTVNLPAGDLPRVSRTVPSGQPSSNPTRAEPPPSSSTPGAPPPSLTLPNRRKMLKSIASSGQPSVNTLLGPVDPALVPPPPSGSSTHGGANLALGEDSHHSTYAVSGNSQAEGMWEDNTLPPLVWEELS